MSKKISYSIIILAVLAIVGGFAYFFFYLNKPAPKGNGAITAQNPFTPLGSAGVGNNGGSNKGGQGGTSTGAISQVYQYPKVRQIWPTPIGGFVASTTASSTFVRFVDRGTGYIYDMGSDSVAPMNISNTTLPLVYESYWNKSGVSGIFRYIKDGGDDITNFYVQLKTTAAASSSVTGASTATTSGSTQQILGQTQYGLRGTYFPGNILSVAVSPKGNQLFVVENVNGNGVGFISNFDGSGSKQVFSSPMTQISAFWPTTDTLMLATKASADSYGYLYSIDQKTGTMDTVFGGVYGLSVLPNPTAQLILYSDLSSAGNLVTSLYNTKNDSSQDLPLVTLADKCVWSKKNPVDVFCAVPSTVPPTGYPDMWYQGTDSTTDSIVEIDTDTGNTHPVSNVSVAAKTPIDAEWLALDPSERFLYFVNKKDLSLWSVDLNQK